MKFRKRLKFNRTYPWPRILHPDGVLVCFGEEVEGPVELVHVERLQTVDEAVSRSSEPVVDLQEKWLKINCGSHSIGSWLMLTFSYCDQYFQNLSVRPFNSQPSKELVKLILSVG